jgi:hypothetical protein
MDSNDELAPRDVDVDAERFVGPDEADEDLPDHLDAPIGAPVDDVLEQHREVVIDDEADDGA